MVIGAEGVLDQGGFWLSILPPWRGAVLYGVGLFGGAGTLSSNRLLSRSHGGPHLGIRLLWCGRLAFSVVCTQGFLASYRADELLRPMVIVH